MQAASDGLDGDKSTVPWPGSKSWSCPASDPDDSAPECMTKLSLKATNFPRDSLPTLDKYPGLTRTPDYARLVWTEVCGYLV
ncbi:hypothetical protein FOPE_07759 [Fonsecaea pedrosoi]|nr:hypothetical protein FOPE_07759 [Fonsecaea pedrosoi]